MSTIEDRLPEDAEPLSNATEPNATEPNAAERRFTPGRVALGLLVAGSFAVWGYGFSGLAGRTAPDTLGNSSFLDVAEPACAAANDTVAAMPDALDAEDNRERSQQVINNTAVYGDLVDELERLLDDPRVDLNDRDSGITLEWLADWRQFLADRIDYADRLADDPQAVFYVAASSGGERLERRITRFAQTNELLSCVTPQDVG